MNIVLTLLILILQHGHPYISAMVNNGTLAYDHDRDGTHTELAGCEAQIRNKNHETHVAIRYEMNVLTVRDLVIPFILWGQVTICFILNVN